MYSNTPPIVSVLIPCYNEEEGLCTLHSRLVEVVQDLSNYKFEFLFVNDGSSDETLREMYKLRDVDKRVNVLNLSRNFGKECAMLAGIDFVKGDCCILMDADLQDPPELIVDMLREWEKGYDDVYARRSSRGKESWLRKRLSLAFYSLLRHTSNIDIIPNVGDFRLLDRRCIRTLRSLRESERYSKGLFSWIGYRKKEIIFDRADRTTGSSKWNFFSLFNLAIEGITSFSVAPLRLASLMGIVISFTTFVYMIYFLIKTSIFGDEVAGFPTLIIVILFLGAVQLLSLGILGEYIGRIFMETKHRPTYIASEYNEKKLGYDEDTQDIGRR